MHRNRDQRPKIRRYASGLSVLAKANAFHPWTFPNERGADFGCSFCSLKIVAREIPSRLVNWSAVSFMGWAQPGEGSNALGDSLKFWETDHDGHCRCRADAVARFDPLTLNGLGRSTSALWVTGRSVIRHAHSRGGSRPTGERANMTMESEVVG